MGNRGLKKRLLSDLIITLLVGVGAVFLFSPACSGEEAPAPEQETPLTPDMPDTPDTPDTPDNIDEPEAECDYPDRLEKCKKDKGLTYTCLPDGTCAQCKTGLAGCPCVGSDDDAAKRYCLEGQGKCLPASANAQYNKPFCSWCLPGSEFCACVDGKCGSGLACVSKGADKACVKFDCAEAGDAQGTSCLCSEGGVCDVTSEVCWQGFCRTCPGSEQGCPCSDARECSVDDGLLCQDAAGEPGIKRCQPATACSALSCQDNQLCCDSANTSEPLCSSVDADDHAKCLSTCLTGWTSTQGETCNQCADGYFGAGCTAECPGGALNPCNGQGDCSGGLEGSGQCSCDAGFAGAACDECAPGYWGAACDACPGSAATPCNNHGACSEGKAGDGTCSCNGDWTANDCSQCPQGYEEANGSCVQAGVTCSPECGVNGRCVSNGATTSCECNPGWSGATCDACSSGFYGSACNRCPGPEDAPCNGHGDCSEGLSGSGACTCTAGTGWSGNECDQCPADYNTDDGGCVASGVECSPACTRGTCIDDGNGAGICDCDDGWDASNHCSSCLSGFVGANCTECPGGAQNPCTGHGTCKDDGSCECDGGWFGDACENTCNPGQRLNIDTCEDINECDTNNGGCGPQARVKCTNAQDSGDAALCSCRDDSAHWQRELTCQKPGVLVCQEYEAFDCKDSAGAVLAANHGACGRMGEGCSANATSGTCAPRIINGVTCSEEGAECTSGASTGQCVKAVIEGATCNQEGDTCGSNAEGVCAKEVLDCSVCKEGYYGSNCGNQCPGGYEDPCSGNGVCSGATDPVCTCTAQTGWQGDECDQCADGWVDDGNCDTDIDECAANDGQGLCKNAAVCSEVGIGDYSCACPVRQGTTIPLFVGKNCQNDASDNPGAVVSDGTYYMGGDSYSVEGADEGASNGCSDNSNGSNLVFIPGAASPLFSDDFSNSPDSGFISWAASPSWVRSDGVLTRSLAGGSSWRHLHGENAISLNGTVRATVNSSDDSGDPGVILRSREVNGEIQFYYASLRAKRGAVRVGKWQDGSDSLIGYARMIIEVDTDYVLSFSAENNADGGVDLKVWVDDVEVLSVEDKENILGAGTAGLQIRNTGTCTYDNFEMYDAVQGILPSNCSNSCCDVIECQKWKDCAAIPGTYCTQAYSGADKAYCLPRHPGLREEAKTTANSDKLLAIDMSHSSLDEESPLFKLREGANNEAIFEWQKLEQAAIGSHTIHSGLRCNTNTNSEDGTTFSGLTCRDKGVAIASADNECNGKRFQAECCNSNNECGKCLGTPEEGLTGFLWPVTADNGYPICETKELYSLNSLHNGAVLCDEDGDDWIRDDAYRAFMDTDMGVRSNAKCALKVVETWVLVNEYRQELRVSPKDLSPANDAASSNVPAWICPDPALPCLPLIETAFLDGDNTDDASGVSGNEDDRKGYKLSGGVSDTETVFPANEMNPMLKSCTSNLIDDGSDYNKNGVEDWEENQDSEWSETLFKTVYDELQAYTFFEELYTGTLDGTEYRIEERPRCDLGADWPTKIPLGYNDLEGKSAEESAQWQSCMRAPGAVHANLGAKSSGKVAVNAADLSESGYDFSRFYWGTHSDKRYVEPVAASRQEADISQAISSDSINLAWSRARSNTFSGGWCSVQQDSEHVGVYYPNGFRKVYDSGIQLHTTALESLKGQTFEVDANGDMAPVGCNGCDWRGMNHYSQFQCIQVKSAGTGWTYDKLANESTQDNPDYEYVLNECTKKSNCTETSRGDCLECRRLQLDNNGNGTCTSSGSATCAEGTSDNENKVGFVSIRYGFEDRDEPTNNSDLDNRVIPNDLRGCVAEEMFDDVLCPTTGNFTAGTAGQKPEFLGFSLSPYGKLVCFKEAVCGDSYKDPSERCDYKLDSSCIDSGAGACQCERVDCPDGSTEDEHVVCSVVPAPNGWPATSCVDVSCQKRFPNGPGGQKGTLTGTYGQTLDFTCGDGYEGGDGWTCGANGEFSGGEGCTPCPENKFSVNGEACQDCANAPAVTTPAGQATCSTDCSVVPGAGMGFGTCDSQLAAGENCELECDNGSSLSEGEELTVNCTGSQPNSETVLATFSGTCFADCTKDIANGNQITAPVDDTRNGTCNNGYAGGKSWTCTAPQGNGTTASFEDGTECTQCPDGQYSTGGADCQMCNGANEAGNGVGATECGCQAGYWRSGGTCKVDYQLMSGSLPMYLKRKYEAIAEDNGFKDTLGDLQLWFDPKEHWTRFANNRDYNNEDRNHVYYDFSGKGRNLKLRTDRGMTFGNTQPGDWFVNFDGINDEIKSDGNWPTSTKVRTLYIVLKHHPDIWGNWHQERKGDNPLLTFDDCGSGIWLGKYKNSDLRAVVVGAGVGGSDPDCEEKGHYRSIWRNAGTAIHANQTVIIMLRGTSSQQDKLRVELYGPNVPLCEGCTNTDHKMSDQKDGNGYMQGDIQLRESGFRLGVGNYFNERWEFYGDKIGEVLIFSEFVVWDDHLKIRKYLCKKWGVGQCE